MAPVPLGNIDQPNHSFSFNIPRRRESPSWNDRPTGRPSCERRHTDSWGEFFKSTVDWWCRPHRRCVGAKALDTPYVRLRCFIQIDGRLVMSAAPPVCRRESA